MASVLDESSVLDLTVDSELVDSRGSAERKIEEERRENREQRREREEGEEQREETKNEETGETTWRSGYSSKLDAHSFSSTAQAKLLLEQSSDYQWSRDGDRKKKELGGAPRAPEDHLLFEHNQTAPKRFREPSKQSIESRDVTEQLDVLNTLLLQERATNRALHAEKTELQTALDNLALGALTNAECSETKVQSFQADFEALQIQLRESRSEMRTLRSDLTVKEAELGRLKQLNSSLSGAMSGNQDELVQVQQHYSQLSSRLAAKERECESLTTQKNSFQLKLTQTEKACGAAEAQLSVRTSELERLKTENGELKTNMAEKEQTHKKVSKNFADLLSDFSTKDDDLLAGVKVQNELKNELSQAKTQSKELTAQLAEAETNVASCHQTIATLKAELASKSQANLEIGSRSSQQKDELANLMKTISELQTEVMTVTKQNEKHVAKLKEQQAQLESAEAVRLELKTQTIQQESRLSQLTSQINVSEGKARESHLFAERVAEKEKSLLNVTEELTATQQILMALENELRSTKSRKEDLVLQIDERDAQLTDITSQLQRSQAESAELQHKVAGLSKQVFKLEQNQASLEPEVDRLRLAWNAKERECTKATDALGQTKRELEALQLLHATVEEKLTNLQTSRQGLKVESSKLKDDYQSLEVSLAQEQRHNRELIASENRLKADILELNHEIEQQGLTRSEIEKRLSQKAVDYAALQTENCQLTSKLEASEQTCQALYTSHTEALNQGQELQRTNQQLQAQLLDKGKELGTVNSQCVALRTTIAVKEREAKESLHREEQTQALLASKEAELSQLNSTNVRIEGTLKAREEELRQSNEVKAQTEHKLDEVSTELIETKDFVEKQAHQLAELGQSNVDSLNQLQTMDQEFRTLLAKHQQVQQQHSDFAAEIDELQKKLEAEQKSRQRFESDSSELNTKLTQEKREAVKVSETNAALSSSLTKKEREFDTLQQEQVALTTQLQEIKEELKTLSTSKSVIAVSLRAKEEEVRSLKERQMEIADQLEESQNDCARKQTVISKLEVELEAVRSDTQQKLDAILPVRQTNSELTRKLGILEHENEDLAASKAELVKSRADTMARLAAKNEECGSLTRSLAEATTKLSATEAKLQKLTAELSVCQQVHAEKQQAYLDLEQTANQKSEELARLQKENVRLDEQLNKRERECNQLTSFRESSVVEFSSVEAKLKEMGDRLVEKTQECECVKKNNRELELTVAEQAGRVKRLVDDVSMLEGVLSSKEQQLTKTVTSERKLAASIVEWQMKVKDAENLSTRRENEVRVAQKQVSELQIASTLLTTKIQTLSQSMFQKELECKELSELYRQIQSENILIQDQLKDEQATIEETSRKLAASVASNTSLTQRLSQAGEELSDLRSTSEQYRAQANRQGKETTESVDKRVQELQKLLAEKDSEKRTLLESNKTLTSDLLYSNEQCSALSKQRAEFTARLAEKESELLVLQKLNASRNQTQLDLGDSVKLQQAEKARMDAIEMSNVLKVKVAELSLSREEIERKLIEKDAEVSKIKREFTTLEMQLAQKIMELNKLTDASKPGVDQTLQAKQFELENVQIQINLERKTSECASLLSKQRDLEAALDLAKEQLVTSKQGHATLSSTLQTKETQITELTARLQNVQGGESNNSQLASQLAAQVLELKNLNGTRMSLLAQLSSKDLALAEMTQAHEELKKSLAELKSKSADGSEGDNNLIELEQELQLDTSELQPASADSGKSVSLVRQLESKEQECLRLTSLNQELEAKVRQLQVQERVAVTAEQECKRLKKDLAHASADLTASTSEVTRLKIHLAQAEDRPHIANNAFVKMDEEIKRERDKLTKFEEDLEARETELQTGTQNLQVKIQEFNERVRVLNESAKELKKRRDTPDELSARLADKERECLRLRQEMENARDGSPSNMLEREEALQQAEQALQHGKDELAKKVQMYNERVRVLNKATKDLKQKREQFRRTSGGGAFPDL